MTRPVDPSSGVPANDDAPTTAWPATPPPAGLVPGDLIAGHYRLKEVLGRGGMGEVWRAHDEGLVNRPIALKVVRADLIDQHTQRLFAREIEYGGRVESPNVVRVYAAGVDTSRPGRPLQYLVMELVEGTSLDERLKGETGPLPVPDTLRLLEQAAAGLAAVHAKHVIHRDIKPANLMVSPFGTTVKITDFGVATSPGDTEFADGRVNGTPGWMAPEQYQHEEIFASDVYSLGAVGWYCLTREMTPGGPSPQLPNRVPAPMKRLLAKALDPSPARRWVDGADFHAAIVDTQRQLEWPPVPPPPPKRPVILPVAVTALIAALLTMIGWQALGANGGGGTGTATDQTSQEPSVNEDPVITTTTTPTTTTQVTTTQATTTPPTTSPPPPATIPVSLETLIGKGSTRATVGGQIFKGAIDANGGWVEEIFDATCTSMTLTAGVDDGSHSERSVLTVQVAAGQSGGGSMQVQRGELVTQTFDLDPGDFQLVFTGNAVIIVNGELTCSTPSGKQR